MKKFGILGFPLTHSLSPKIHNMAFDYHKLEGRYEKIEIEPAHFDSRIQELKSGQWSGFNITIPFKEQIIPYFLCLTAALTKSLNNGCTLSTRDFNSG